MPRTNRASRVIAVPREQVYAALIDPSALATWLPPGDMVGTIEQFDARPGGSYRMVLTYPESAGRRGKSTADADIVEAHFLDLVPGLRVVSAVDFVADDPALAGAMTMSWELSDADGGTCVTITAENVPDAISAEDHKTGMTSSLLQLADYLQR